MESSDAQPFMHFNGKWLDEKIQTMATTKGRARCVEPLGEQWGCLARADSRFAPELHVSAGDKCKVVFNVRAEPAP